MHTLTVFAMTLCFCATVAIFATIILLERRGQQKGDRCGFCGRRTRDRH